MKSLTLLTLALLGSHAAAFGLDDIHLWAGTGTNRAGFVVDFQDGTSVRSFAWGYRWNGAATGEDMIRAVDLFDSALTAQVFGSAFGSYLDSLVYGSHSGPTWPTGYWSYWTGSVGNWSYSNIGMSARTLTDGEWDGWSYTRNGSNDSAPSTPVAAVPEPSSLLAVFGGLALVTLRRNQKGRHPQTPHRQG